MKQLNLTIIALLLGYLSFAVPGPITGSNHVCIGSTTTLSDGTPGGVWTSSAAAIASVGSSTGIVTGVSNGTATITYTQGGTSATLSFNVYGLPFAYTLFFSGSGTFCSAGPNPHIYLSGSQTSNSYTLFRNGLIVTTFPGINAMLDFGPIVPVSGDTYGVNAINSTTGCSTLIGPISPVVIPSPGVIVGPSGVCAGSTITLTDTTAGGIWISSAPSIAMVNSSGVVTGISVGTATISYLAPSGCSATMAINVINLVSPIAGPTHICTGSSNLYTDPSAGGSWVSSNPAVATVGSLSGLVTGVTAGTTTISYTVGGTCGYVSTPVTVNIPPVAITGVTSICEGGTTSLADATPGGTWSSSNISVATIGTSGIATSLAAGSTTISYTLSTGCKSTVLLSIDPRPVITGISSICVSGTTTFTTSIPGSWTSSNPFVASITSGGVVTAVAPGTAVITCNSFSTGCVSTHSITVTSSCSGTPSAGVAHAAGSSVCAGYPDLLYLTGASSTCGVTFQWQYSTDSIWWIDLSGATNDSFIANPQSSLYYRCKLTCFTSGISSYSAGVHVSVYNSITAHNTILAPSIYCNGPDFQVTTCGIQPGSNIISYYGDGTKDTTYLSSTTLGVPVATNIFHVYNMAGTYTIKQILRNGSTPQDSVTFSYNYNYCRTLPVSFYFDANNDCVDNDNGYTYSPVSTEVDSNGIAIDTIITTSGFYYNALGPAGTVYTFKVIAHDTGLHMSCPATGVLRDTITTIVNNYPVLKFGFNCTTSSNFDLHITADIDCGRHTASGLIYVGNTYCTVENPVVTMTFSPGYTFGSSWPAPYSVAGNVVTWHLPATSVHSNSWVPHIYYTLNVPGPFLTAGDTVMTSFMVTPLAGDVIPANNIFNRIDTIRASYDPNGIDVSPKGNVIPCTPLQYTIRFENTGNDTARNISVIDTLPDNVNIKTLNVVSATSAVTMTTTSYSGHNVVKFDLPHINLPDSSHHDICHGEVTFSVNAKAGLADGSIIRNFASIYFDDNLPVKTDTVYNFIGISPIVGPANVCSGATMILTDQSANGIWSSANANATVSGSGLVSGVTPGTDTILYTSSNSCTSRSVSGIITIYPVAVPAVSISPSTGMGDTICVGSIPTFTAVPVNGGPLPAYEWMVNGSVVGTDSTYTFVPAMGDVVTVKLTSNALCTSPDTAVSFMIMNVLAATAPIDSMIAIPGLIVSPGMIDTFIAFITSPGPRPSFAWYVNGLPTGDTTDTFVTHTLVDKDSVTCITTASDLCKLSSFNSFIITVTTVGVNNLNFLNGMMVYPNPNKGEFTIHGTLTANTDEDVYAEINNLLGQTVFTSTLHSRKGIIDERIHMSNSISNGMYILTLRSGSNSKVYHFIVEQ